MIFENSYVVEVWVSVADLFCRCALVEGDFEIDASALYESICGTFQYTAVEEEAVGAAVEGYEGFVVFHAAIEGFDVGGGDVGRVGDDQLEGLGIDTVDEGCIEIALFDGDTAGEAEAFDVTAGDDDGFFAEIGGDDDRVFEMMADGGGDATAAGAEVEDAGRFHAGGVAGELEDIFHQRFGVGAGDEDVAIDFKFEVKKVCGSGEVFNRLLLCGALDEGAEGGEFDIVEGAVVIGVEADAGVQ